MPLPGRYVSTCMYLCKEATNAEMCHHGLCLGNRNVLPFGRAQRPGSGTGAGAGDSRAGEEECSAESAGANGRRYTLPQSTARGGV